MDLFTFDDAYIQRLRERDPATVEHFCNYFRELLSAKIRNWLRSTRSTEELGDVLQEVFVRVFQRLKDVREPSKFGSFVNSTCTYILHEAGRNGNRVVPLEETHERANDTDLDRELEVKRTQAAVRIVLACMPLREAEILRAVFIDEIPRDEICRQKHIEQPYLRVLIHRAKEKFRDIYGRLFPRRPR